MPVTGPEGLSRSALDSERFGLSVYRGVFARLDPASLAAEILRCDCDVAIVRVPAGTPFDVGRLVGWALEPVHADTLVYYERPLEPASRTVADPSVRELEPTAENSEALSILARRVFRNYQSHYCASGLFVRDKIDAGYADWAGKLLTGGRATVLGYVIDDLLVGFLAAEEAPGGAVEIVLNGVDPEVQGRGVYGALLRAAVRRATALGATRLRVSTQVHNYRVQRVWAREGFALTEAWNTFHVVAPRARARGGVERTPLVLPAGGPLDARTVTEVVGHQLSSDGTRPTGLVVRVVRSAPEERYWASVRRDVDAAGGLMTVAHVTREDGALAAVVRADNSNVVGDR